MYSCGSYPLMLSAFVCAMIAVAGAVVALTTPRWYVVDTQGNGRKEFSLFEICDQFSAPNYTTETTTTLLPTLAPPYSAPVGTCYPYTSTSPFEFVKQFTFRTSEATAPPASGQPTLAPSPYECPISGDDMNSYFLTTIGLGSAGVFMAGCGMLAILVDCIRWCLMRSRVQRNIAKRKLRHVKRKKLEQQQQQQAAATAAVESAGGGGSVEDVVIDFEEGGQITGSFEARVVDDRTVSILTILATIFFGLANVLLVAAIGHFASVFDSGKPFCNGKYGNACNLLKLYDDDAYHFSDCEAFYGYSYSLAILSWVASLCALALLIARIVSVICCKITNINEDDLDDVSTSEDEGDQELGELQQEMIGNTSISTPPRPGTTSSTSTKAEEAVAKKKASKEQKEEEERYNIAAAKEHQNKQFNPIDMYRQAHQDDEEDSNGGGLAVLTTGARPVEEEDDIEDLDLDIPTVGDEGNVDDDGDLDLDASQNQQHQLHTPAPRGGSGGGGKGAAASSSASIVVGPVNVSGAAKHPGEPDVTELPDGRWEWDEEAELFWNEEQEYFYDHQSEQFYDPDTEQWYNRKTGKWYSL